ncbi:MAG TPA: histidine kinase [Rubrivivax sp.]|nr:histidine kinase [Rubrivivax sp.]
MSRRETAGAAPGASAPPTPSTPSPPWRADSHDPARPHRARRSAPPLRRGEWAAIALLGCLCLFAWLRVVAQTPAVDARWRADGASLQLESSPLPALSGLAGARLAQIVGTDGSPLAVDAGLLQRSVRWSVDDAQRSLQLSRQRQLAAMLSQGPLTLHFDDGRQAELAPRARGFEGLGVFFWLMSAAAMTLLLVTAAVLRVHAHWRNLPYAVIGLGQAGNLLLIGVEMLPGLGLPTVFAVHGAWARMAFDLCSAAAMVHLATLQPLRLPAGRWIAAAAWAGCALLLWLAKAQALRHEWGWTQAGMLGCGALTIALMSWSYRLEPNPFALLLRRLASAATATLLLLSVAMIAARGTPAFHGDAAFAALVWHLFLATLVLVLPSFSRAQPLMREVAMLAGTASAAISLGLLFEAAWGIGDFAALALAVAAALLVYSGTRRWLMRPMRGQHVPGAERMFERLYRVLREVEARPRDSAELLTRLLNDLFEPLEVRTLERTTTRSRVLGEGSALLVPLPAIGAGPGSGPVDDPGGTIVLRFAERGKRMFSADDARLTDRVVEQLRLALAYDRAVERGRSEERARIAADLHDDIGARLLTLMYQAQTPEMEDYLRHTLKDLKTLTRGLASGDQRLSHAAAEWKADIAQRLGAAQIELSWTFAFDRDLVLGVVQWSALTRVLRELVSNVIQHSCATHLEVAAALEGARLRLTLADDGIGRNPQAWSHGLGLGGVRKRVKLLGGDVQWRENGSAGIVCTVLIPDLQPRH